MQSQVKHIGSLHGFKVTAYLPANPVDSPYCFCKYKGTVVTDTLEFPREDCFYKRT